MTTKALKGISTKIGEDWATLEFFLVRLHSVFSSAQLLLLQLLQHQDQQVLKRLSAGGDLPHRCSGKAQTPVS